MRGLGVRSMLAVAAAVAFLVAVPAVAHHGTAAFDTDKTITVTGTMTEFKYVNPHAQLYFEHKNEKGEMEQWQGELTAPNKLSRAGWTKNTLRVGDMVTVGGNPARNGLHVMWIRSLIGPHGEALKLAED